MARTSSTSSRRCSIPRSAATHSPTSSPYYGEAGIVVNAAGIPVRRHQRRTATVRVTLQPTVPHCHLMMLIGLSVRAKLLFDLPRMNTTWRIELAVAEGSHQQEADITKQINDKERVCAALENPRLLAEIQKLINPMEFVC